MAKTCWIERNDKRRKLSKQYAGKRAKLKAIIQNRDLPIEERFEATLKLSELPKNSNKNRIRNRCELTGRSRGTFRKFKLSRHSMRKLALNGQLPGVTKSSW